MNRQIITFLSSSGGAGRTTSVMALASAFVERPAPSEVLVIDATDEAQLAHLRETTLSRWISQMRRCGVSVGVLAFTRVTNPDELARVIKAEEKLGRLSRSPILIDTSARLDDLGLAAVAHADLVITPFMDALMAFRISEALAEIDLGETPIYGLRCGPACDVENERAVMAAFTAGRILQRGLPTFELFADLSVGGHVAKMLEDMMRSSAACPWGHPERDRVSEAIAAKTDLDRLTDEILLALDGYELRPRTPMSPRPPLPLRELAELLPT